MSDGQAHHASDNSNTTSDVMSDVVAYVADRDWFLQDLIRIANSGLEISITIVAEGAIVSGILISGKNYFHEIGAEIGKVKTSPGISDLLQTIGGQWAANGARYVKPEDASDDWAPPEPGYIHLRDARIYAPGQGGIPSNRGVLWRGKLNAVSGFSIGGLDHR